jgi:hypothetical protein
MTAEVSIIPHVDSVADFKKGLKDWTPKSDAEAGNLIALKSILNSTGGEAAIKAANARLSRKCEDCDVLEFDGFTLKAVRKTQRTYHESAAITKLEDKIAGLNQKLKEAKADLDAARVKAGFNESDPIFSHWLVQ